MWVMRTEATQRRKLGERVRAAMRERRRRSAALDHQPQAAEPVPSTTLADMLRWAGLSVGLIASLAWGFALADRYFGLLGSRTMHDVAAVTLVAVNFIAWFVAQQDGRGSQLAAIAAGIAFSAFAAATADSWHLVAALLSGGPFIAAGTLLLVADSLDGAGEDDGEGR